MNSMFGTKPKLRPILNPETSFKDESTEVMLATYLKQLADGQKSHHKLQQNIQCILQKCVEATIIKAAEQAEIIDVEQPRCAPNAEQISSWIGEAYRRTSHNTYQLFRQGTIDERQLRMTFCDSLLKEICEFMSKYNRLGCDERQKIIEILDVQSRKVLKYLLQKYPQSTNKFKASQLSTKIEQRACESDPRYDILRNMAMDIFQDMYSIGSDVKRLLNELLRESHAQYPSFHNAVSGIFEAYPDAHYKVGLKFRQETEPYTEQQINEDTFVLKGPQVLRILIKWYEELKALFTDRKVISDKIFPFKGILNQSQIISVDESLKSDLIGYLKKAYREEVEPALISIEKDFTKSLSQLFTIAQMSTQNLPYLDRGDVMAGRLSALISSILPGYIQLAISQLIKSLRSVSNCEKKSLHNIDLVKFSVFDMLRCKCEAPLHTILKIYEDIRKSKDFELIRVKNRLDLSTRDVLLNLKLNKSYLICQVQLAVSSHSSAFNDSFNHFLYEQSRSSFGPLAECATILFNILPQATFWLTYQQSYSAPIKYLMSKSEYKCLNCQQNQSISTFKPTMPFVCMGCQRTFHNCQQFFKPLLCRTNSCQISVCFWCYYSVSPEPQRSKLLLEHLSQQLIFFDRRYIQVISDTVPDAAIPKGQYALLVCFTQRAIYKTILKRLSSGKVYQSFSSMKNPQQNKKQKNIKILLIANKPTKICSFRELAQDEFVEYLIPIGNSDILSTVYTKDLNAVFLIDGTHKLVIDVEENEEKITANEMARKVTEYIVRENNFKAGTLSITDLSITHELSLIDQINQHKLIKIVNFSNNCLSSIQPLAKFTNIESLQLRHNSIENCSALSVLAHLKELDISYNKINKLELYQTYSLKNLNIQHNKITHLEIQKLSQLQTLNASQNLLSAVSNLPANIQVLRIRANQITDCSNLAGIFQCLSELDLSSNQIQKMPKMRLPSLTSIDLRFNLCGDLKNFQDSILPSLRSLNLQGNNLLEIRTLPFPLEQLSLKKNKLTTIDFICEAKWRVHLQSLNLSSNSIADIWPTEDLLSLKYLNLNENPLETLDQLVIRIPKIEHLTVCGCRLIEIPAMRLSYLRELHLSRNQIASMLLLSQSELPQLHTLTLSYNRIKRIQYIGFPRLKRLLTEGNDLDQSTLINLFVRSILL